MLSSVEQMGQREGLMARLELGRGVGGVGLVVVGGWRVLAVDGVGIAGWVRLGLGAEDGSNRCVRVRVDRSMIDDAAMLTIVVPL